MSTKRHAVYKFRVGDRVTYGGESGIVVGRYRYHKYLLGNFYSVFFEGKKPSFKLKFPTDIWHGWTVCFAEHYLRLAPKTYDSVVH